MQTLPGKAFPIGATVYKDGVNFCVFSKHATKVELLLFSNEKSKKATDVISLKPEYNKTHFYWHVFVKGVSAGQIYAYRCYGPYEPENGHRFDGKKVLIDPYSKAIFVGENYVRKSAIDAGDNIASSMRSVVVDTEMYDWEGDKPLNRPLSETVIYEMHVKGFTKHENSNVNSNTSGTYAGLIKKIPYLKKLGVTAVELLPIHQYDEQDVMPPLKNYWGYNTIGFFAPHRSYSSDNSPLGPVNEFRDMVKELHKAGIEVILDVVYNHTAEGDEHGPTLCFRGFENKAYYILNEGNGYANYSGCGNTMKANHSIVRQMIMDSLHYWVKEMHVDGFRFDLASVLSRDDKGKPLENPPILWSIETDPVLAGTKMIAEAWDAGGLYQVGQFIGDRWMEWNGKYRDDIRKFIKGDDGVIKDFANRISGSRDFYTAPERAPLRTINYITSHDGFTLHDLVSYNEKHNDANREFNIDGSDQNYSWNCGIEGITNIRSINELRKRQIKNFLTILYFSQGTPMMLGGDELCRTQHGNNNAYCQDNETSWFDWSLEKENSDVVRFLKELIQIRLQHPIFKELRYWTENPLESSKFIRWHGVELDKPDWADHSHSLAYTLMHPESEESFHIMINAYWEKLEFALPTLPSKKQWYKMIDTRLQSPDDIAVPGKRTKLKKDSVTLIPRSVMVISTFS